MYSLISLSSASKINSLQPTVTTKFAVCFFEETNKHFVNNLDYVLTMLIRI